MIICQLEPLTGERERLLREWLQKEPVATLRRVVTAKMQAHAAKALTEAIQSKDYERKLESGNASLQAAQRYQTFLDVLTEITDPKTPYHASKLI